MARGLKDLFETCSMSLVIVASVEGNGMDGWMDGWMDARIHDSLNA